MGSFAAAKSRQKGVWRSSQMENRETMDILSWASLEKLKKHVINYGQ